MIYDKVIVGAGMYGLYAALFCAKQNEKIKVLEYDDAPFKRASYINQARVHMGYHYPRSYSTAIKSAKYFQRFCDDYGFCVNGKFDQIYATSTSFSWTNAEQFQRFCNNANIPCEKVSPDKYFNKDLCDGAFLTQEYTFDAVLLKNFFLNELRKYPNVDIEFNVRIKKIVKFNNYFEIFFLNGTKIQTNFLLNATYASTNQIIRKIETIEKLPLFRIKYELCEIILCKAINKLKNIGITVMDGPFFSIMPFGQTGYHSLTSVTYTPHVTSYNDIPIFKCQIDNIDFCNSGQLGNCNNCPNKPTTAYPYMSSMAKKYLRKEYDFEYVDSLFSMKPILQVSEIDDSRPTVIRKLSDKPILISVLSGKINTVYDLDEVLKK